VSGNKLQTKMNIREVNAGYFMLMDFSIYNAFLVLSDGLVGQLTAGWAMNSDEEKEVEHTEL
jgi:hypothetical protein